MAYALVGVQGTTATGTTSCTPSYPQTATAGHLLILWVHNFGSAGFPTTPTGYSIGINKAGSSAESASIFYKVAAGGESGTVSVSGMSGSSCAATICEFSGNASSSPLDQTGSGSGSTSPVVATAGGVNAATGELVVASSTAFYSTANTKTTSNTWNDGGLSNLASNSNDGTSTVNHYNEQAGTLANNSSAISDSFAFTTTKISGTAVAVASFKLGATVTVQIPTSFAVLQAVHRTSTY